MTAVTNEYLAKTGYRLEPAPVDDWRQFNESDPAPGYFQFDWFSAYHPDLYHKFSRSSEGLMDALEQLVDLSGLVVADIGAGTGRSTIRAAKHAKQVYAIDAFKSVLYFSRCLTENAGIRNITYLHSHRADIPLPISSVDASIASWAYMDYAEAYRITKPNGYVIFMGAAPCALCGELTAVLASEYPALIECAAPAEVYDPSYPPHDFEPEGNTWNDLPLAAPLHVHDFTYVADYEQVDEAAAIAGRLYGPKAKAYLQARSQATLSWRLRIEVARIAK